MPNLEKLKDVNPLVKPIQEQAKHLYFRDDDWVDDDGLRHCAKCGGAKEAIFEVGEGFEPLRGAFACPCQQAEIDKIEARREAEERQYQVARRRSIALRSKSLREARFDADHNPTSKVSQFFRRYCDRWDEMLANGLGIRITGGVGTGKSFYAACVCNEIIDRGGTAYFVTIPEILEASQGFENTNLRWEIAQNITRAQLVVFDDVGAERATSYASEKVYDAINDRLETGLPTIVTTNYSDKDLQTSADIQERRIFDRILQMCQMPIALAGESKRGVESRKRLELAMEIMRGEG